MGRWDGSGSGVGDGGGSPSLNCFVRYMGKQARLISERLKGRGLIFSGMQVIIRDVAGKVDKKAAHREGS